MIPGKEVSCFGCGEAEAPHPYLRSIHQLTVPWRGAFFFSHQDSQNLISDGELLLRTQLWNRWELVVTMEGILFFRCSDTDDSPCSNDIHIPLHLQTILVIHEVSDILLVCFLFVFFKDMTMRWKYIEKEILGPVRFE